jgi:hypothetical protein
MSAMRYCSLVLMLTSEAAIYAARNRPSGPNRWWIPLGRSFKVLQFPNVRWHGLQNCPARAELPHPQGVPRYPSLKPIAELIIL